MTLAKASKPGKILSEAPTVDPSAEVYDCELGVWTEVGARTKMIETTLGDYSYVVNDSDIIYSEIGKFVNIASHARLNPGQHPMEKASLHHFQYRSKAYGFGDDDQDFFNWRRASRVTVGHDVWIGHGVVVQGGVELGTGCVVGSGAVVTKDVPPYYIVTGVPSKTLRPRFDVSIQNALLRICWWNWTHSQLSERLDDFRSLTVEDFCLKYDPS